MLSVLWTWSTWVVELLATFVACVVGLCLSGPSYFLAKRSTPRTFPRMVEFPKKRATISVVIPCLNEAATIGRTLRWINETAVDRDAIEVVIVDAGSTDGTKEAAEAVDMSIRTVVVTSERGGRGQSLRRGVQASTGALLLFLHADTLPPLGWDKLVRDSLRDPTVILGSFAFAVDRSSFDRKNRWGGCPTGMGTVEWFANFRAKHFELPYGDQGLFLLRERLEMLGGIADVVVMEDFELVRRARTTAMAEGRRVLVRDEPALCSGRRWEVNGVPYTTITNQAIVLSYTLLGFSDREVYQLYYGKAPPATGDVDAPQPSSSAVSAASSSAASSSAFYSSSSTARSPVAPMRLPGSLRTGAASPPAASSPSSNPASAGAAPRSPVAPPSMPAGLVSHSTWASAARFPSVAAAAAARGQGSAAESKEEEHVVVHERFHHSDAVTKARVGVLQ